MTNLTRVLAVALSSSVLSVPAIAQQPPDAGRVLQETTPPSLEAPRPGPRLDLSAPLPPVAEPGGPQVTVSAITLDGNAVLSDAELLAGLGDAVGQSYDLAGLQSLAARVTEQYHAAGYPFARALLPQQRMGDGVLAITVIEGRYGAVSAVGDDALAGGAEHFLSDLEPGAVISSASLERATLILDDLPGISASPIIRPGQDVGTGDLVVTVERGALVTGDVSVDNHGSRYTGYHRARANVQINSPFMAGDQIALRTLASDEELYLGSASYSAPLGGSGLRGQASAAHTTYHLGREFSVADASGRATVYTAGLVYPLVRSQVSNLTLGGTFQFKDLKDEANQTNDGKTSQSVPIALQFDHRDALGGGGVTFGTLTWTPGRLNLDASLRAQDINAGSHGTFHKVNLDIARLQSLPSSFSFYGRFSGQLACKNLDSSEGFSLGGPNGVRAYPSGEANGDEGWVAQAEVRYTMGAFSPYVFFDAGGIRTNANPWTTTGNTRDLSGTGFGLRATYEGWNFDGSLSWRTAGGRPESDTRDRQPQVWVNAGYAF